MLSKRPEEERLSCIELLAKTHEWTVDSNRVRSDEYYNEFISVLDSNDNLKILKVFIQTYSTISTPSKNINDERLFSEISGDINH